MTGKLARHRRHAIVPPADPILTPEQKTHERVRRIKGVFAMAREQDRLRAEVRRLRDAIGAIKPESYRRAGGYVSEGPHEVEAFLRLAEIAKEGEQ